jgi:two-component system chemotaxis sensor kinase CheA
VELVIQGGDVEVERAVLERLVDPLFHLVRNAIGHGIESPAERKQAGKPEWGTVTVRAIRLEGAVAIEVEDDGAGVNLGALRRVAAEQGVNGSDDKDVARLVFEAGLSTADQVTPISGRGIGLDVVRARVRELGGQVELVTHADFGTTFRIEVPETPAETATAPDLEDSD